MKNLRKIMADEGFKIARRPYRSEREDIDEQLMDIPRTDTGVRLPALRDLPQTKAVVLHTDYGGFSLTKEAERMLSEIIGEKVDQYDFSYPSRSKYPRHHPALIYVVKRLGNRAGKNLEVVPISGSKYIINEYDGAEWVQTPSSIKWISI